MKDAGNPDAHSRLSSPRSRPSFQVICRRHLQLIGLAYRVMFARDRAGPAASLPVDYRTWLAFACPACHCSQIWIRSNQTTHIDGSPINVIFNGVCLFWHLGYTAELNGGGFVLQTRCCVQCTPSFFQLLWSPFHGRRPARRANRLRVDGLRPFNRADPAASLRSYSCGVVHRSYISVVL